MSDGKITLRFNGNPNTVNSNQSAPVSQVDIGLADSNEIKLKQVSKPVAAVAPTQNRESANGSFYSSLIFWKFGTCGKNCCSVMLSHFPVASVDDGFEF